MMGYGWGGGWFITLPWWSAFLTLLLVALLIWMNVLVLQKAGHSPWWAALVLFPFFYLIGLWVFAFARWPRVDGLLAGLPDALPPETPRRPPTVDRRL